MMGTAALISFHKLTSIPPPPSFLSLSPSPTVSPAHLSLSLFVLPPFFSFVERIVRQRRRSSPRSMLSPLTQAPGRARPFQRGSGLCSAPRHSMAKVIWGDLYFHRSVTLSPALLSSSPRGPRSANYWGIHWQVAAALQSIANSDRGESAVN